jgi:hypothetical protein
MADVQALWLAAGDDIAEAACLVYAALLLPTRKLRLDRSFDRLQNDHNVHAALTATQAGDILAALV